MTHSHKSPNIVIILLDTLRADRLSCYGYNKKTSRNIDKVADTGLLFENTIASGPWTIPSHASLFTGLHPFEHGANDETLCLAQDIPTLAELLAEIGYRTVAYATDNMWFSKTTNLLKGFDEVHEILTKSQTKSFFNRAIEKFRNRVLRKEPLSSSVKATKIIISYLKQNRHKDKPLFVFLNLMDTHMPYQPDLKFFKLFGLEKYDSAELDYLQNNFKEYRTTPGILSSHQLQILNDLYDACVATADANLSELFTVLNHPEQQDNTIVVVTSDHGECLGEHGLLNHWMNLYDTLLKVPLIISCPARFPKPGRFAHQIQQHDLFYTLLELASYSGNKIDAQLIKSRSLLSYIERNTPFPEYVMAEHAFPKMTVGHIRKFNPEFNDEKLICSKQMIRTNNYKYIKYGSGLEELFDLKNDPGETKNIFAEYGSVADTLKKELEKVRSAQRKKTHATSKPEDFAPEIIKRLTDLGYM